MNRPIWRPGRHPTPGRLTRFRLQQAQTQWVIAGQTLDASGSVLGGCSVHLFTTDDDVEQQQQVSDPVTGAFSFLLPLDQVVRAEQYYCVAYLAGSPDVAGTTVNTLAPQAV
jgi:hypothetical protein